MSKSRLNEVTFGSVTIQKLRRITLDQNLLKTLALEEGDSIDVVLLVETGEIRLRKSGIEDSLPQKKVGASDS